MDADVEAVLDALPGLDEAFERSDLGAVRDLLADFDTKIGGSGVFTTAPSPQRG